MRHTAWSVASKHYNSGVRSLTKNFIDQVCTAWVPTRHVVTPKILSQDVLVLIVNPWGWILLESPLLWLFKSRRQGSGRRGSPRSLNTWQCLKIKFF